MFWDRVAWAYDLFANGMNRKANRALCAAVEKLIAPADEVLECACGTGLLTGVIAGKCTRLVATDFSANMLRRAAKKCGGYGNVTFEQADILHLNFPDERFDTVVAANVIHLLDDPYRALAEMNRVCKAGGRLIIPTYMNQTEQGTSTPPVRRHRQNGRPFQAGIHPGLLQKLSGGRRVREGRLHPVRRAHSLRGRGAPKRRKDDAA